MSLVNHLKEFINVRLTAAAEEIFLEFEKAIVEYEEVIDRQRKLLDITWKPQITDCHSSPEVPHKSSSRPDASNNLRLCEETLNQNPDPAATESVHIKEEEEGGLLTNQPFHKNEPQTFLLSPINEGSSHSDLVLSNTSAQEYPQIEEDKDEISGAAFLETSETENKPFCCNAFGERFKEKSKFTLHARANTVEKPFSCRVCGKTFALNKNLGRHMTTHSGEKPDTCKVSGKFFRHTPTLACHKRMLTGEKPFSCHVCGNKFTLRKNLRRHTMTHTGEKPFNCEVCGKCYTRKYLLVEHMWTHNNNKPHE